MRENLQMRQVGLAFLLAGVFVLISLVLLQGVVLAKIKGKGAFGCGELDQATIDGSDPGDTIMMMEFETSSDGPVVIGKRLTLQGGWRPISDDCQNDLNGDPYTATFDTLAEALVYFNYDPNKISDLPAPIDYPPAPLGPILIISPSLSAKLTLEQLKFDRNEISNQSGAGIAGTVSNNAQVILKKARVEQNIVTNGNGGGLNLTVQNGARLEISDTQFNNNQATGEGGGVRLIIKGGSVVTITDSRFSGNQGNSGAGLSADVREGSRLVILNSQFLSNTVNTGGGGFEIFVRDNSQVLINNTQVASNTSTNGSGGGGRLVIDYGSVTIVNSAFFGNKANNGSGGGLTARGTGVGPASLILENTLINNNTALVNNNLHLTGTVVLLDKRLFLPIVLKK